MADTRCAVPDLQLDVDLMILEYILHQTLRAHLEAAGAEARAEAERLLIIFHQFIRLFNHSHPTHVKSHQLSLNLMILEFVVLHSTLHPRAFSDDHVVALRRETSNNLSARRNWLRVREEENLALPLSSAKALSRDVERQVFAAWDHGTTAGDGHTIGDERTPSLFDLLPRFMDISAEMSLVLEADPNESWMNIACEFMLQAALESLRSQSEIGMLDADAELSRPSLEECFAWGYTNSDLWSDDSEERQYALEVFVNGLFLSPSEDLDDESLPRENPLWTTIRAEYVSEFSIADDASVQSQTWRLDRLTETYPPDVFRAKLTEYMQRVWQEHCECNGVPVLVEIEQGHIASLDVHGQDFDDFMTTVGLRRDAEGILKFKL